ncbi:ubiquitin-conjugating enzyme/RWD-like protein [Gorgonomyces haynaldii]|nr:ubiquitin-conjugating enzyme/RWD-like protein [Gorgonomyces haynaldii]
MPDLRRIDREIRQCKSDRESQVDVQPINDNLLHLKGVFKGPQDTPYEGGTFVVDIQIPDEYPFKPPKMKFDTMIYHPNISSQTGAICLDILKDQWTPVLTLKTALISLQSLLCDPVPNDPQDAQVASHYLKDRKGFEDTARQWTRLHAMGGFVVDEEAGLDKDVIGRLEQMGFDRKRVVQALRQAGNENGAIDLLLQ